MELTALLRLTLYPNLPAMPFHKELGDCETETGSLTGLLCGSLWTVKCLKNRFVFLVRNPNSRILD